MRIYLNPDFRDIFGTNYLTKYNLAYEKNIRFRVYIDRYSESQNISEEEAPHHMLVPRDTAHAVSSCIAGRTFTLTTSIPI